VGRSAEAEGVEEEAELRAGLLRADTEPGEDARLDVGRWIRIDPPPSSIPFRTTS